MKILLANIKMGIRMEYPMKKGMMKLIQPITRKMPIISS
jgi:hypothetical protein